MEVTTIGLDLAKRVFQAHGADASGKAVLRHRLQPEVLKFFASARQ
jgi:transposase